MDIDSDNSHESDNDVVIEMINNGITKERIITLQEKDPKIINYNNNKNNNNNDIKYDSLKILIFDGFNDIKTGQSDILKEIKGLRSFVCNQLMSFREKLLKIFELKTTNQAITGKKRNLTKMLAETIDWYSFQDIPSMIDSIEWVEMLEFAEFPDEYIY